MSMIQVNLVPFEEIEDKTWWLPDIVIVGGVYLAVAFASSLYISDRQAQVLAADQVTAELQQNTTRLEPELIKFAEYQKQVKFLHAKVEALKKITIAGSSKYKTSIILEHLQTIKPEGVWYSYVKDHSEDSMVEIAGGAFDNLLVAEFMAALNSTGLQDVDPQDLRSQIYFREIHLDGVSTGEKNLRAGGSESSRQGGTNSMTPIFGGKKSLSAGGAAATHQGDSAIRFPEIKNYPMFVVRLIYAERSPTVPNELGM